MSNTEKDLGDAKKVENDELEKVSGGGLGDTIAKGIVWHLLGIDFEKNMKKSKCVDCGKKIKIYCGPMGLVGSEMGRHSYYNERCRECAKKHPYIGDIYDEEKDMFVTVGLDEWYEHNKNKNK